MKTDNIYAVIFAAVFVGVITIVKESLFPDINFLLSFIINLLIFFVGYWLGNKIFPKKDNDS